MIWHPKLGRRVELRYNAGLRKIPHFAGLHRACGVVICAAAGRTQVNAAVRLDDGRVLVAPRGNLTEAKNG